MGWWEKNAKRLGLGVRRDFDVAADIGLKPMSVRTARRRLKAYAGGQLRLPGGRPKIKATCKCGIVFETHSGGVFCGNRCGNAYRKYGEWGPAYSRYLRIVDSAVNALAEKFGVKKTTMRERLNTGRGPTPRELLSIPEDLLGVYSDRSIAKMLGVSHGAVKRRRVRLGIQKARWSNPRKINVDWSNVPLGEVSDAWIADAMGVCAETVRRQRASLGISPAMRRPKKGRKGESK